MKKYLENREKEVIDIMMALFDQQKAMEQFGYEKKMEGREEGRLEGRLEGRKQGRLEGREQGRLEGKRETAFNMKEKGYPDAIIADLLEVGLNIVQGWFAAGTTAKP